MNAVLRVLRRTRPAPPVAPGRVARLAELLGSHAYRDLARAALSDSLGHVLRAAGERPERPAGDAGLHPPAWRLADGVVIHVLDDRSSYLARLRIRRLCAASEITGLVAVTDQPWGDDALGHVVHETGTPTTTVRVLRWQDS